MENETKMLLSPEIFISKGELDRLDCRFNNPKYDKEIELINSTNYDTKKLSEISFVTDGDHGSPKYVDEGVPYLRAINIQDDKLKLDKHLKYISKKYNEPIKKSLIKEGDILLVTVGATIGKIALVKEVLEPTNLSRDVALIRVKSDILLPKFLYYFLQSELGQLQIKHFISGALQDGLYLENLNKIVTLVPPIQKQKEIIDNIDKIFKKSGLHLENYDKAKYEISNYIDRQLSIVPKEEKNTYLVGGEEIKDRLDCYFYNPIYKKIRKKLQNINIKDIEVIPSSKLDYNHTVDKSFVEKNSKKFFKYLDIGNTNKKIDSIKGFEEGMLIRLPTRARQLANKNDVLIPRPIGSTNTIIKIDEDFEGNLYSTGFISIRNNESEMASLIQAVMKSNIVQEQIFYLQSGSVQPEITPSNFKEFVLLPIPKGEFRTKMIQDIKELYRTMKFEFESYVNEKEMAKKIFLKELLK